MTRRPRLLDLFCGAGGAGMGYHRAGFEVVGVDLSEQPRYPFEFHQADALTFPLEDFDVIHASPPCQGYSQARHLAQLASPRDLAYPLLVEAVRARLLSSGRPFVIENVIGAPLRDAVRLCGTAVGLPLRRHRLFESNLALLVPPCAHRDYPAIWKVPVGDPRRRKRDDGTVKLSRFVAVYGSTRYRGEDADRKAAMGIDWMRRAELTQAIPPAYTELIGHQVMAQL